MISKSVVAYMKTDQVLSGFADVLGEHEAKAYISSVLIAVRNDDRLMQCDPKSIYISALRAAGLRLSVDPAVGQAYLVPFKNQCTLLVGYKGLYDMAIRTGKYRYINVSKVYEGEEWIEDRMTGLHTLEGGRVSDEVIGWFASFQMMEGYTKTLYMPLEEIHDHAKEYSKSYNSADSLWKKNPKVMERKTPLRILLTKWGYIAPSDRAHLMAAEADDWVTDDIVDAEVVEKPKKSAEEIVTEFGFDPSSDEVKIKPWPKKAIDVVRAKTHLQSDEEINEFLKDSKLSREATVAVIRKFAGLYQEAYNKGGGSRQDCLNYAWDNWGDK